jgi:2,3-bisphosphoglycerate-independent phosphoglycerate mutase
MEPRPRGIGRLIGWEVLDVAGATGVPDTDYSAKGRAAVGTLDSCDLVCEHVQAPQTLGLLGNVAGKIDALEATDRQIVAPVLERLEAEPEWRALVIPAQTGGRRSHPELAACTLFVLAGSGIESRRGEAFVEKNAIVGELHPDRASDLMDYFVRCQATRR